MVDTARTVLTLFAVLMAVLGGVLASGLDGADVDVDEHQRVPGVRTSGTPEARRADRQG